MNPLPDGYKKTEMGSGWAVVREDWTDFFGEMAESGSVSEFTRQRRDVHVLQGRGELQVSRDPRGRPYVVRKLRHGGFLASLTGDRFWLESRPRPLNELMVSVELARSGVVTPEVIAACVYPGRFTYTGEVVREYLEDARDLAAFVFDPATETNERKRILSATSGLIQQLGSLGLYHPDLNLRNVLVAPATLPSEVMIIDLEKCTFGDNRPDSVARMSARMMRSARKLCEHRGALWHGEEWAVFETGLRQND